MPASHTLYEIITSGVVNGLKSAFAAPNIPLKKLQGAHSSISKSHADPKDILVVQDQTVFGSATDGMLFTSQALYIKPAFESVFYCQYVDIAQVVHEAKSLSIFDKVNIVLNDGRVYTIKGNTYIDPKNFTVWLTRVVQQAKLETNQLGHDAVFSTERPPVDQSFASQASAAQSSQASQSTQAASFSSEPNSPSSLNSKNRVGQNSSYIDATFESTPPSAMQELQDNQSTASNLESASNLNIASNSNGATNATSGAGAVVDSDLSANHGVDVSANPNVVASSDADSQVNQAKENYSAQDASLHSNTEPSKNENNTSTSSALNLSSSECGTSDENQANSDNSEKNQSDKNSSVENAAEEQDVYALATVPAVKPQLPDGLTPDLFILLTKEYSYGLDHAYGAPNIPERKLNGAISGIAKNKIKPEEVLFIADDTIFGGADNGFLGTIDHLYFCEMLEKPREVKWINIKHVTLRDKKIILELFSGGMYVLENFSMILRDRKRVAVWLQAVADVARYETAQARISGEDNNDKQVLSGLDQMPREQQYLYMQIISNFLLSDDNKISPREAGLFYALLSRIRLTAEDRYNLRLYQADPQHIEDTQVLVERLTENLTRISKQLILISLVKDMINIHMQTNCDGSFYSGTNLVSKDDDSSKRSEVAIANRQSFLEDPFIQAFANNNGISREQLICIKEAIIADNKLFDDNIDDAGLNSALSNLAATAGAVGLPLAAIYFSGSVIGLSAAGITSGLATLGLGGLFGLSSMATGIGAIILIGLGANKGIKMLTGQDERDKRAHKQAMLFAVNRQLTCSINLLVEDINTFTQELLKQVKTAQALEQDVSAKEQAMAELIERLEQLSIFSAGSELLIEDSNIVETKAYRQNLPIKLNVDRLRAITDEPTKAPLFDTILSLYEEKEELNKEGERVKNYTLRSDLSNDEAKFLSEALNKLEYFSVSGLAKSGLANIKSLWN